MATISSTHDITTSHPGCNKNGNGSLSYSQITPLTNRLCVGIAKYEISRRPHSQESSIIEEASQARPSIFILRDLYPSIYFLVEAQLTMVHLRNHTRLGLLRLFSHLFLNILIFSCLVYTSIQSSQVSHPVLKILDHVFF